jgi:hypothetical protein
MEHVSVTRASAFVQRDHLAHHDQGLSGYVDIARLLHKAKLEGDHRSGAWYSIFQRK